MVFDAAIIVRATVNARRYCFGKQKRTFLPVSQVLAFKTVIIADFCDVLSFLSLPLLSVRLLTLGATALEDQKQYDDLFSYLVPFF